MSTLYGHIKKRKLKYCFFLKDFCHSVGFFVLVRFLSCAYSYENVTIIKRSLLKSVFIIGVVAAVFDHPPSKYQQTGVV